MSREVCSSGYALVRWPSRRAQRQLYRYLRAHPPARLGAAPAACTAVCLLPLASRLRSGSSFGAAAAASQTKIHIFAGLRSNGDICGLQVSMHDAALVRLFQRRGNLHSRATTFLRELPLVSRPQVFSRSTPSQESPSRPACRTRRPSRYWMVQLGQGQGFLRKCYGPCRRSEYRGQNLQCHITVELLIPARYTTPILRGYFFQDA